MKSNILNACRRNVRSAVAIAALLVLGGFTAAGQPFASPVSPVNVWDCLLSGSGEQGIAFLTFSNDGTNRTFSGYQLTTQNQRTSSGGGRNSGGDAGRSISTDTNAPPSGGTNLIGFSPVTGPWQFDEKGRVIGYFSVVGGFHTCVTNVTVTPGTTNDITGVITLPQTNVVIDCGGITNAISFVAKVVGGKRLTLVSSTPSGKVTYKGVPYKNILPGIGGSWYATKKENKQQFVEFFNLTSFATANPFVGIPDVTNYLNIYFSTNGTGPGLSFSAFSMLSSQKKIGFVFETFSAGDTSITSTTEGTLGATFGSFSRSSKATKANTKGFEEPSPGTTLSVPMTFQGVLEPGL